MPFQLAMQQVGSRTGNARICSEYRGFCEEDGSRRRVRCGGSDQQSFPDRQSFSFAARSGDHSGADRSLPLLEASLRLPQGHLPDSARVCHAVVPGSPADVTRDDRGK